MTAFLKKIGFATAEGTPTDLYKKFRNPVSEGWAAAQALKAGYGPLYVRNEYMHRLSDEDLKGLVLEETGAEQESTVVGLVIACIKQLKKFAKWDSPPPAEEKTEKPAAELVPVPGNQQNHAQMPPSPGVPQRLGLNLGYTINLNLPATSDPAVFNAIFRALKEHLLKASNE